MSRALAMLGGMTSEQTTAGAERLRASGTRQGSAVPITVTRAGARALGPRPTWRRTGLRAATAALAALGVLGLAACAPEPGEQPAPSTEAPAPTTAPQPSPEPSPEETAPPRPALTAPVTVPACGELVSGEHVTELGGPGYEVLDAETATRLRGVMRDGVMGPAAVAALDGATTSSACAWGVPNSGSLTVLILAVLDPAARDEFRAALDASDFAKETGDEVTAYTLTASGGISSVTQGYLFSGDVWVAEFGQPQHPFADAALSALRLANTPVAAG